VCEKEMALLSPRISPRIPSCVEGEETTYKNFGTFVGRSQIQQKLYEFIGANVNTLLDEYLGREKGEKVT